MLNIDHSSLHFTFHKQNILSGSQQELERTDFKNPPTLKLKNLWPLKTFTKTKQLDYTNFKKEKECGALFEQYLYLIHLAAISGICHNHLMKHTATHCPKFGYYYGRAQLQYFTSRICF